MRAAVIAVAAVVLSSFAAVLPAQEPVDLDAVTRIRIEGFRNSQVMDLAAVLADRYGARLTGSAELREASDWAQAKLASWGLANAHQESWTFGRGWSWEAATLRMTAPARAQLVAIPHAWSPGTEGEVRGKAVIAKLATKEDLEKYRGTLEGAIVLNGELVEVKPHEKAALNRLDDDRLAEISQYRAPGGRRDRGGDWRERIGMRRARNEFLAAEKVALVISPGDGGDGGTFDVVASGSHEVDANCGVPSVVIPVEQFNRLVRLIQAKHEVELEGEVRARFHDDAPAPTNVIAELPGTDRRGEVVMIGAHIDSWHAGTGATDNAAGVAVVMEAMRILSTLPGKPHRTIRVALWSAEEQGLLGARAYVSQHFGAWSEPEDPAQRRVPRFLREDKGTLELKPDHGKLSCYFNVDTGTGRIRGIHAQENAANVPIFEAWLKPLHDLGATTVTMRDTSGSDHAAFNDVGLPGFFFLQDPVEYGRTHHSNADVYDRLQREDLMQAAVVVASFAWHAANRPAMMPRKPTP